MKNATAIGLLFSASLAVLVAGCDDKAKTDTTKSDAGTTTTTAAKDAGGTTTTTSATTMKADSGATGTATTDGADGGGTMAAADAAAAHTPAKHDEGTAFVLAPMKLMASQSKDGKDMKPVLELKADGTLMHDGKAVGKFVGAHLESDTGKVEVWINKDNSINSDDMADDESGHFDDKDQFVGKRHGKEATFSIADDGTISVTADGKTEKIPQMKFDGFQPKARRVAMIMLLGTMRGAREHMEHMGADGGMATGAASGSASGTTPTTAPSAKATH